MSTLSGPNQFGPVGDSLTRHTTAQTAVGFRMYGAAGEFVYVTAAGAITTSGDPVSFGAGLGAVVRGDLDVGAFLGVAEAPFASGESGFVCVKGLTTAIVESGAVAGQELQLSGTVGKLKAVTTSGSAVAVAQAAADDASAARVSVYLLGR